MERNHKRLAGLVEKGALKLITPRVREDMVDGDPRDPATFVWEDVVSVEPHPYKEHLLRARTAEGSEIDGTPAALLPRLQEWRTYREAQEAEARRADAYHRDLDDMDENER